MNILVLGSGGREHAIIKALKKSHQLGKLYIAPGNAGINEDAEAVSLDLKNFEEVRNFCKNSNIDIVFVGPEDPLVNGISNYLQNYNICVVGPSKEGARLEGSKAFTKEICDKYNIPTASYQKFTKAEDAKDYANKMDLPIVIKADGLAAGKGVIIANSYKEAHNAIDDILVHKVFGQAGTSLVIEEFLIGEEASYFVLADGKSYVILGNAQDHKRAFDHDEGPNTGGMGTYSPAPVVDVETEERIVSQIVEPMLNGLKKEGIIYKGIMFFGLMIHNEQPKLIEINVRLGDPETQVILPLIENDFIDILNAYKHQRLSEIKIRHAKKSALCVVMASKGYPGEYKKGSIIKNLASAQTLKNILVYHAGTKLDKDGNITANGGRVLGICAVADNIKQAQEQAYKAVNVIDWQEGFYRKDIGWRAL